MAGYERSGASQGLNVASLIVKNSKGTVLEPGKRVAKVFKDREDVFVEGSVVEKKTERKQAKSSEGKVEIKKVKELSVAQKALVDSLLGQGEELEEKDRLRAAVACYEQVQ